MALFAKDKRICRIVCRPPLCCPTVVGHGAGVGIIAIAILVLLALVIIF